MKNVELVGRISEKLQNLLRKTISEASSRETTPANHCASGQVQAKGLEQSEREDLVDELMRKVGELRSVEQQQERPQQQRSGEEAGDGEGEQRRPSAMIERRHETSTDGPSAALSQQQQQARFFASVEQQHQMGAALEAQQRQVSQQLGGANSQALAIQQTGEQQFAAQSIARHLSQQAQSQAAIESYLMRQRQQAALEQQFNCLRTVSSCSNESTSSASSSSGRYSSLAAHHHAHHFLLEPSGLDHLMDCSTSSSSRLAASPVCGSAAAASQHHQSHAGSPSPSQLFARLSRQLRLLESPTDSGIESGKENGSHSALGFSAACLSPISGHSALAAPHQQGLLSAQVRATTTASQWAREQQEKMARNLNHSHLAALGAADSLSTQPGGQATRAHMRPASALGQVCAGAPLECRSKPAAEHGQQQQTGSLDDMPMLKRALQAPPLINTNMLMDEAYRHHKKFRASQRAATSCGTHPTVNSTSGLASASTKCTASPASTAPQSPASSPAPCGERASSSLARASPSPANDRSAKQHSLADMHSTLLQKLAQKPANVSEQQLKRSDLINEIILKAEQQDEEEEELQLSGDEDEQRQREADEMIEVPSGVLAPASSPASTCSALLGGWQPDQLHKILLSGAQKQQQARQLQQQHKLLGNLSHHLVDEDYITRRLLHSGAFRRHHQRHHQDGAKSAATKLPGAGCQAGDDPSTAAAKHHRHTHHRPSSSSCGSSSSPSPTSSLSSTLSPSPSSSMSPDLGMMSRSQLGGQQLGLVVQAAATVQSAQEQQEVPARRLVEAPGGNFGLLADVALAELEQRQQQQRQQQQLAAAAQPIDLSKK